MNKMMKILGGLSLIVIALFVAMIVLAKILITPERIKQTVLPLAEQALQRDVELGDINISLLSGVELHALKIREPDSDDVFMAADLVRLKYQLLPLLALKVVIDEVRLERPQVKIARLSDGSYNFSDIVEAEKGSAGSDQHADDDSANSGGETPITLLVSQVRVIDGSVLFLDHLLNDQAPYRFQIKDIQAAANGIKLTGAVPFQVRFAVDDSQVAIDGELDLLSQSGHIQLDLQQLNLLAFRPYIADKVPGTLGGMTVDLHTVLDVTQSELSAKGRLDITDLDLTLEALPDAPLQNARVDVDHDLKFNLERGHLDLKQLDVDFNGLPASMSGSLNGLFETPMLNATVQTPGIDLRTAMVAVPTELVSGVKDFDPAGKLKFEAELTGSFDKPLKLLKSALITIENVQATLGGQRPSLDGRVRVVGDQAQSEDLKVRLGDNTADLSVKARNFYGKPLIAVLDVKSKRFELDPLLRGGGAAALAGNSPPPTTTSGLSPQHGLSEKAVEKDIGPFDI
ncbi:MAG: DUF748 domain-containing protein, partial [Deltaproteobacteria bacterium]|nr:DUF748 domain-containing protein [Deltaproteobacteria bacterium]